MEKLNHTKRRLFLLLLIDNNRNHQQHYRSPNTKCLGFKIYVDHCKKQKTNSAPYQSVFC